MLTETLKSDRYHYTLRSDFTHIYGLDTELGVSANYERFLWNICGGYEMPTWALFHSNAWSYQMLDLYILFLR